MFEVTAGDDDILVQEFVDENGDPVNIENYLIKFTARDPNTKEILLEKSSAVVTEIEKRVPYTGGVAYIYISRSDTEGIHGAYEYDIEITFPNNTVATFARDFMLVKEGVTP